MNDTDTHHNEVTEPSIDELLKMPVPLELFVAESNLPVQFSIGLEKTEEKAQYLLKIKKLIENGGGALKFHDDVIGHHTIPLIKKGEVILDAKFDLFKVQFVFDCIKSRELADLNLYRANNTLYDREMDANLILNGEKSWSDFTRKKVSGEYISGFSDGEESVRLRPHNVSSKVRKLYTVSEEKAILNYVIEKRLYNRTKGNVIWREMEAANICMGRTWQSLKERYAKKIVTNLAPFKLDKSMAKKLLKFADKGSLPFSDSEYDEVKDVDGLTGANPAHQKEKLPTATEGKQHAKPATDAPAPQAKHRRHQLMFVSDSDQSLHLDRNAQNTQFTENKQQSDSTITSGEAVQSGVFDLSAVAEEVPEMDLNIQSPRISSQGNDNPEGKCSPPSDIPLTQQTVFASCSSTSTRSQSPLLPPEASSSQQLPDSCPTSSDFLPRSEHPNPSRFVSSSEQMQDSSSLLQAGCEVGDGELREVSDSPGECAEVLFTLDYDMKEELDWPNMMSELTLQETQHPLDAFSPTALKKDTTKKNIDAELSGSETDYLEWSDLEKEANSKKSKIRNKGLMKIISEDSDSPPASLKSRCLTNRKRYISESSDDEELIHPPSDSESSCIESQRKRVKKQPSNRVSGSPNKKDVYETFASDSNESTMDSPALSQTSSKSSAEREHKPSESRRRKVSKERRLFSFKEDMKILRFIDKYCSHSLVKGVRLWKTMESRKIVKDRTWQSLKERYLKRIVPQFGRYVGKGLSEKCEGKIQKMAKSLKRKSEKQCIAINAYRKEEDVKILKFISRNKRFNEIGGVRLWKLMENRVEGRSWQSLKNRFLKHILTNLRNYKLSPEDKTRFTNIIDSRHLFSTTGTDSEDSSEESATETEQSYKRTPSAHFSNQNSLPATDEDSDASADLSNSCFTTKKAPTHIDSDFPVNENDAVSSNDEMDKEPEAPATSTPICGPVANVSATNPDIPSDHKEPTPARTGSEGLLRTNLRRKKIRRIVV